MLKWLKEYRYYRILKKLDQRRSEYWVDYYFVKGGIL
jgi:hypothetical protein